MDTAALDSVLAILRLVPGTFEVVNLKNIMCNQKHWTRIGSSLRFFTNGL